MTDPTSLPDDQGAPPEVISEDRAKQGRRGLHVLIILVVSAVLAAIAMFAIWGGQSGDLADAEDSQVSEPADVSGIDQPTDVVRQAPEGEQVETSETAD